MIRRYIARANDFQGKKLCEVEMARSLIEAAEMAAIMLDRSEARQVAALTDDTRGVFIAHGRVPWEKSKKPVREIRFALVLEVP